MFLRDPPRGLLSRASTHILNEETTYQELGSEYQELGSDYFERRDKGQITRRLIRRLEQLGLSVEVKAAA